MRHIMFLIIIIGWLWSLKILMGTEIGSAVHWLLLSLMSMLYLYHLEKEKQELRVENDGDGE